MGDLVPQIPSGFLSPAHSLLQQRKPLNTRCDENNTEEKAEGDLLSKSLVLFCAADL